MPIVPFSCSWPPTLLMATLPPEPRFHSGSPLPSVSSAHNHHSKICCLPGPIRPPIRYGCRKRRTEDQSFLPPAHQISRKEKSHACFHRSPLGSPLVASCRVGVGAVAGLLSLVGGDVDERTLVAVDHASSAINMHALKFSGRSSTIL